MASISDIAKQYTEMRQGLKQLGLELELYWPNPDEQISNDASNNEASSLKEILPDGKEMTENDNNLPETDTKSASIQESTEVLSLIEESVEENASNIDDNTEKPVSLKSEANHSENNDHQSEHKAENVQDIQKLSYQSPDRFMRVMEDYRNSANNRFVELEALYVNVDVKWREIMLYYGENPKLMRPDEFFNVFAQFLNSWKVASEEEQKYSEKIEREDRRRIEIEQKRKITTTSAEEENNDAKTLSAMDNDRRVMDNLMEQLRSGKIENKVRQRRRVPRTKNYEA